MITIRSGSSMFHHKDRNVTKSVLGFVIETADIREKTLVYVKNTNVDENYKVPLKDTPFKSSDIIIMMDTDFTEKNYEIYYFGYMDILGIIGGLNASISPIIGLLAPLFIINYLITLA